MTAQQKLLINLELLRALDSVAPMALPEATLQTQVRLVLSRTVHTSEFSECIRDLEGKRLIVGISPGDLGGEHKFSITDSGRAQLAANG